MRLENRSLLPMECRGCGNQEPWVVNHKKEAMTGKIYDECNKCFDPSIPKNPDVYFKTPYWDEQLLDWDDPTCDNNKGTFIRSKEHKAYVLKKLGMREAGDRKRGFRNEDMLRYKTKHGITG